MKKIIFALVWVLLLFPSDVYAQSINGRVVGVHDGDTLKLLTAEKNTLTVRLAEVDAPELKQPYGAKSKQALSGLVFGKEVRIVSGNPDRYGRTLGRVFVGKIDVNLEMVRTGNAWVYTAYSKDPALQYAEDVAKAKKVGLWSLQEDQIISPWEWRHPKIKQPVKKENLTRSSQAKGFVCDGKRYCKQMRSCSEAKFYLNSCGISRLDGDGDGIPCESICR